MSIFSHIDHLPKTYYGGTQPSSSNSQGVHVPKLRFPGFEGEWSIHLLSEYLSESKIPGSDGKQAKKLSVKLWAKGVVEKNTVFEGSENTQYYIRKAGQLMYGKLDFLNCAFGIVPPELDGYESTLDAPAFDISNINSTFLLSRIIQRDFYKKNGDIANGSRKAKRIHPDTFLSMEITSPTLQEQEKIAEFIICLDKRIEKQRKLVEHLKSYKRGALSKLFPKNGENTPEYRFAGFTEPWRKRLLGELGSVSMCKRIFKEQTSEVGEIPFYKIGTFGRTADSFISRELFEEYKAKYSYPTKGTILISASGSIGRTVEFTGNDEYFQDSNIVWLTHDKQLDDTFLKCFYEIVEWVGIEGSTIKRLYNDNILKTKIALPSIEEQQTIGKFFRNIDVWITLHQKQFDMLQEKKSGLLQQLFM